MSRHHRWLYAFLRALLPDATTADAALSETVKRIDARGQTIASDQFVESAERIAFEVADAVRRAAVPAAFVILISWLVFVPLAHMLSFAPGQGWVDFLPQWGLGATGGWYSVVIYSMLVGTALLARWRSRAWQRLPVRLP